jgi:hypothetical protein
MTHTKVWILLIGCGFAYHAGKSALGFEANWSDWGDSIYWGGAALAMHWIATRTEAHSR